jgi:hypothetical protein
MFAVDDSFIGDHLWLWLKKIILLFKFKNIYCYLVKPEPLALLDRRKNKIKAAPMSIMMETGATVLDGVDWGDGFAVGARKIGWFPNKFFLYYYYY